jgi:hypothetical protein
MVYPAKRDWWISGLVVPSSLLLVGLATLTAYQAATQAVPPLLGVLGAVLWAGIAGLMLSMFSGTSYEIGETHLISRLGPFRFRVPLEAIEEVVSTTGFCLVMGLGLSWSLDMLHVYYRKPNGRRAFPVSISPRDKAGFLQELAAAAPEVRIKGAGYERDARG